MEKNICHANTSQKKAAVAVSTPDKEDFRAKNNISDEKGHFIKIKGSIYQEDITVINICDPR